MGRPMRGDDIFNLRSVGQVELHPDGEQLVFTITWPDKETDENRSQIFIHQGSEHRQLTVGHKDVSPLFSPTGDRIAFLRSEPKGRPQPAIVDLESGAVELLSGYEEDGAEQIQWLDDERVVVRAARRPGGQVGVDDDELGRRPRVVRTLNYRFNGRGWTHDRKRQVEIVVLSSGEITRLSNPEVDHSDMASSPDGSAVLVVSTTDADADLSGGNRVWSVATDKSGASLLTPTPGQWEGVGFTSEGSPFAIGSASTGQVALARPYLLDPSGESEPTSVGDHDVNCSAALGGGARAAAVPGSILAPGIRRTTMTVDRYDLATNELTTLVAGNYVVRDFASTPDTSRIVASITTPTRPAELWEFGTDGERVLVALNDELLAELDLADVEVVQVRSTDGVDVEAFVVRPPASAPQEDGPGPGLIYIHGGPMSIYSHGFFDEFQLAAADGYTVIAGNPRGSDGYGEVWARSIVGDLGGKDWDDVQALTDHLAALAEVDDDRIGIGGGSYGGFMTSWAIGHTTRYRAALVERAVTNWETFAGTSDIGSYFLPTLLGANPETDVASLRHQSPLSYAVEVETPTLILHAEDDFRCPIEQAEQLFAAYRRNGVDVTFARFPGENHELSRSGSPVHRVERMRIVHDFFAEHLKPGSSTI